MIRTFTEHLTLIDTGDDAQFMRLAQAYLARGFRITPAAGDRLGKVYDVRRTITVRPTPYPAPAERLAA
ncbi:hypothetical protein [Chitinolyticbacter meiyuanensis]|uniref:hypothetical protein n=1 Tax=Chitinolyticbacter meiyuanensis TaxID=682798 RepID=UPI0011E5A7BC|nr:hypothetical protein [Chitinolyticbacter meiyuanensis]